jgi:hypothetical protein
MQQQRTQKKIDNIATLAANAFPVNGWQQQIHERSL